MGCNNGYINRCNSSLSCGISNTLVKKLIAEKCGETTEEDIVIPVPDPDPIPDPDDGEIVEPPWPPELVLPVKLKAETESYGELPVFINFVGGSALVDFGDGSEVLEYTDSVEHTYPASPVEGEMVAYTITLTPTSRIPMLYTDIRELTDWGSAGSVKRFRFSHMSPSVPASLPSWIKDTSYMFYGCRGFNSDISGWDVSNVTNMEYMLFQCSSLNSDLGGWDVSKVTNMKYMLSECHGHLGTFENWDVSSVTDMSHMFDSANIATYANLSQWDVSNVTDMSYLLAGIQSSHNFNSDLSKWNTSKVTNMSHMFYRCYSLFDKNSSVGNWSLEKWDVSKVTNMEGMFHSCFNGVSSNISRWKTGNVTNMKEMFAGCQNMNHLTFWDTSKVTTMEGMFEDAYQFNSDISNWDVSNVVNMTRMFKGVQWMVVSLDKWCVENIREEPLWFAPDADYMPEENKPVWGTCPIREVR